MLPSIPDDGGELNDEYLNPSRWYCVARNSLYEIGNATQLSATVLLVEASQLQLDFLLPSRQPEISDEIHMGHCTQYSHPLKNFEVFHRSTKLQSIYYRS